MAISAPTGFTLSNWAAAQTQYDRELPPEPAIEDDDRAEAHARLECALDKLLDDILYKETLLREVLHQTIDEIVQFDDEQFQLRVRRIVDHVVSELIAEIKF